MQTKKVAPVYVDDSGTLFERVKQTDALRDINAIREIVGEGTTAEVRWLKPIGTSHNSNAERARFDKLLGDDKAKEDARKAHTAAQDIGEIPAISAKDIAEANNADTKADAKVDQKTDAAGKTRSTVKK